MVELNELLYTISGRNINFFILKLVVDRNHNKKILLVY